MKEQKSPGKILVSLSPQELTCITNLVAYEREVLDTLKADIRRKPKYDRAIKIINQVSTKLQTHADSF